MKVKTLSVLAGISAPLILTAPSDAGFVGLKVAKKLDGLQFGLDVVNVYAEFDAPGDWVQGVAGTPFVAMNITVIGGSFWNQAGGGDTAPSTFLTGIIPSLKFDSFYTIGKKVIAAGVTDFTNLVNQPILAGTSISTTNGAWAIVPPTADQGNPFDPVNSFPGNGQLLIGQFSTSDGVGIIGSFLLQYISDGVVTASEESFAWGLPTPGALGLLGVAGLIARRRRR
jgi:MYXO-CTERM domain-containing protein